MGALAIAIPYVLFVWWFSTGAILFLIGMRSSNGVLLKAGAALLFVVSLVGVAASSHEANAAGAYCVFTCAILLWGAVEISLLAGWITGPRPEVCPPQAKGADRVWYALQAIAYHELALILTAGVVFVVTVGAPNQLGWWTFASLLALRQSAKLNLFLGVRTLNDELLPAGVGFLRSYFVRKPMNALFPVSVTAATASAAFLAFTSINAESGFTELACALLAVLVALGALEHWFMVLPLPVADLWRWAVRATKSEPVPTAAPAASRPVLSVIPGGAASADRQPVKSPLPSARQTLEDKFRQEYLDHQRLLRGAPVAPRLIGIVPQNVPTAINRTAEGSVL